MCGGNAQPGWKGLRYFNSDHSIVRNTEMILDGKKYIFDDCGTVILDKLADGKPSELKMPDLLVPADDELIRCGFGNMFSENNVVMGTVLVNGKECSIRLSFTEDRKLSGIYFTRPHEDAEYIMKMITEKYGQLENTVNAYNTAVYTYQDNIVKDGRQYPLRISVNDSSQTGSTEIAIGIMDTPAQVLS